MCSICKTSIPDFAIEHNEEMCPLRKSRYCSYCAKYGHLTKKCPAKPHFIEPTYLEQLIPPSDITYYNITSKTPITYQKEEEQLLLEIKDDDKVIGAYLMTRSIKVQKGFTKRYTIEEYATLHNKRIVYI